MLSAKWQPLHPGGDELSHVCDIDGLVQERRNFIA